MLWSSEILNNSVKRFTLPISADIGDYVEIVDGFGDLDISPVTLLRNGHNIQGITDDMTLSIPDKRYIIIYRGVSYGWRVV